MESEKSQPGAGQAEVKLDNEYSSGQIKTYCPACMSDGTLCGYYETDKCPHYGGPYAELRRIFGLEEGNTGEELEPR
jgi:hypothetical protein